VAAAVLAVAGAVAGTITVRTWRATPPDRLVRQAAAEFNAGRWDRAESMLAQLRSQTVDTWVLRAQLAIARSRTDLALEALSHVPDAHPMAPWAWLRHGQLELRQHRLRLAELAFLRSLALDPRVDQARRELVYIYGMQLRRRNLDAQFRVLAERGPLTRDEVMTWCMARVINWEPREVASDLRRFVEADAADRWSRLALVESLRQQGLFDAAEAALDPLPKTDPDVRALRARIALECGDRCVATALLAEGPADHPALASLRGRLALSTRDLPAAIRHYREALAAEPSQRDALFGLWRALKLAGQSLAARPLQDASLAQDALDKRLQSLTLQPGPDEPTAWRELGALCEAAGRLPEARAWYRLAIARDPLDFQAQEGLFRLARAITTLPPAE
jgi:tetratricopeptide (TPR) repeat protein